MASSGHGEDVSRQREEVLAIGQQFLAQLVPGSQEYNELQAAIQSLAEQVASPANEQGMARDLGTRLVSQQSQRAMSGEALTPQQAQTNTAFQKLRDVSAYTPEEDAIFKALRDEVGGSDIQLAQIFGDLVSRAKSPDQFFDSTLQPQLTLAFDDINRQAAQRGLTTSGIPIEMSQRAAAELAIREAEARNQFRQDSLANVQDLFNVGQGLRERAIGVEGQGVSLASGRESEILQLLANQTASSADRQDRLGQRSTARQEEMTAYNLDQEEAKSQRLNKMIGTGLAIGGSILMPAAAPALLGGAAASWSGGGGGSASQLLSQQRAPVPGTSQAATTPSSQLSISGGQSNDQFAALLRALQSSGKAGF